VKYQKALTPDRPYFMYFAPGAVHAPHHVPKQYIDKWKGKCEGGWDVMREQILARQIKMGIVPAGTKLAPKPEAIQNWESLTPDQKNCFAARLKCLPDFWIWLTMKLAAC
jgi:arylsulfatase A-like enzyme